MKVLLEHRAFLESPRWYKGRYWVCDIFAGVILAVSPEGKVEEIPLGEEPSGLGWLTSGEMLAVSMSRRRLLKLRGAHIVEQTELSTIVPGWPNDLVVDRMGRAYIGGTGMDIFKEEPIAPSVIVRVDPGGKPIVAAQDMIFPNGMVITPDGGTLIVAETFAQRLTAFAIGPSGELLNRHTWAKLGDQPGGGDLRQFFKPGTLLPDGIALDSEGCIWAADVFGGRAVRIREGGEILEERKASEGYGVFACGLGGPTGRTLFLCANAHRDPDEARAHRTAQLIAHEVNVGCAR